MIPRKRKQHIREFIETILIALAIALAIRTFVVEVYRVEGASMLNTLHTEERVLVNKFIYHLRTPRRGEIIVFQYPADPSRDFIKRIVAVAGDRVEMRKGQVYVNGNLLPEASTVRPSATDMPERVVPENAVWVLGDNRNNSADSRIFGEVALHLVRGPAFWRIWPLTQISNLTNPLDEASDTARQ